VRAEEDRDAAVRCGGLHPSKQVAELVPLDADPEAAEVTAHALGDRSLVPGRARNRSQLEEERQGVGDGDQWGSLARAAFVCGRSGGSTALTERGSAVYIGVGTVILIILLVLILIYLF
jgi:hypothetical protein